jgi:hypothetical protein
MTNEYSPKFDIDLEYGAIFEDKVRNILFNDKTEIAKVEVKTERDWWDKTNNICFELEYKGKKSGLQNTDAKWWIQCFDSNGEVCLMMLIPVDKLKEKVLSLVKSGDARLEYAGDNKESLVALMTNEVFIKNMIKP